MYLLLVRAQIKDYMDSPFGYGKLAAVLGTQRCLRPLAGGVKGDEFGLLIDIAFGEV